jgi:hypothetical protein
MDKGTWGWKLKYVILFLWIFLFSCKAHEAEETKTQAVKKETVAASFHLWKWMQTSIVYAK